MGLIENSILKTLIYSDIFDFPLTPDEISLLLISTKKISKEEIKKNLSKIEKIEKKERYYFLKGRKNIVSLRKRRERESVLKIKNNLFLLKLIGLIPTIKFLGISGSVAVKNAKKEDDLDLFIITKEDTLWLSRFLVICVLMIFGKKRDVGYRVSPDKICANMFIDEGALLISKKNLFVAKEIAQILPIINKSKTYENFISRNKWINRYLANFPILKSERKITTSSFLLELLNNIFFIVQRRYMKNKITIEKIEKDYAWFHPNDISDRINKEFLNRTLFILREKSSRKNRSMEKNSYKKSLSYNVILTPGY